MQLNCACSKKCGGCDYAGISYSEQLHNKNKYMQSLLGKFCKVNSIIGMDDPYHYRCKVNATYTFLKNGSYISGVYEKGTHRVVKVDDCLITDSLANNIIISIRDLLKSFKIKTFNEDTGYGLLRHVQVRVGKNTGQVMVILVCSSPTFPGKNDFVKALRNIHPEIDTIILNVNDKKTSMVMGERNIVMYGRGYIEDTLCGLRFRISPGSFYQVNPVQTEILYNTAIEYAGLTGAETVMDAYCGTGTIGLIAGRAAKNVLSVELSKDAVKDAIFNAKNNGIKNVKFFQADATNYIRHMAEMGECKPDCIFMDPPRTGSTPEFIKAVGELNPSRVVYVSCGPESLARDMDVFKRYGYGVERIQPIDCFPFTQHIETVSLLSRETGQHAKDYIKA